jgi:methionyl-tRNA formyltransferase
MENKTIVLLAGPGFSTHAVYHALAAAYPIAHVVVEAPVAKKTFLQRRIKKLGFFTVAGQVMFQAMMVPLLERLSQNRKKEIQRQYGLDGRPLPDSEVTAVPSINDEQVIQLLQQWKPDLIVVNGTRIISKKVLGSVGCPFINTHAGITPQYRGVHGTYWALASHDAANSGVTVHLVDAGIDTGGILYQAKVTPEKSDNFVTYPLLQLAAGIPLLLKAVADALQGRLSAVPTPGSGGAKGKLWHHPTLWQYLYNRIVHKIK